MHQNKKKEEEIINHAFNSVADIFDHDQVNKALYSLNTVEQRIKLVDKFQKRKLEKEELNLIQELNDKAVVIGQVKSKLFKNIRRTNSELEEQMFSRTKTEKNIKRASNINTRNTIDSNLSLKEKDEKNGILSPKSSDLENDDNKQKQQQSRQQVSQPKVRSSVFIGNQEVDMGAFKCLNLLNKKDKPRKSSLPITNLENKKDKKKQLKLNFLNKDKQDSQNPSQNKLKSDKSLEGGTQEQKEMYVKFKKNEPAQSLIKEYITIQNLKEKNHKKKLQMRIQRQDSHLYKYLVYQEKKMQKNQKDMTLDMDIFKSQQQQQQQQQQNQNFPNYKTSYASPQYNNTTEGSPRNNFVVRHNNGIEKNANSTLGSPQNSQLNYQQHYFQDFNAFVLQNKYTRNMKQKCDKKNKEEQNQKKLELHTPSGSVSYFHHSEVNSPVKQSQQNNYTYQGQNFLNPINNNNNNNNLDYDSNSEQII